MGQLNHTHPQGSGLSSEDRTGRVQEAEVANDIEETVFSGHNEPDVHISS